MAPAAEGRRRTSSRLAQRAPAGDNLGRRHQRPGKCGVSYRVRGPAMSEPAGVHPSMRKADVWPLSPVETVLLAILAYLVLLISLVGARLSGGEAPPQQAMIAALVANARPAFAEQAAQQMALA